jgi:hypothetical protein
MTSHETSALAWQPHRRLIVRRLSGTGPTLPLAVVSVSDALADWQPEARLCRAHDRTRPIQIVPDAIAAYLDEVQRAQARGELEVFVLASAEEAPELALFLTANERLGPRQIDSLHFSLPSGGPLLATERVVPLMARICAAFGAYHGSVEDENLALLYRGARVAARASAATPPHLRRYLPDMALPGAAGRLPALLVPQEFDSRLVPDAVWWVNYWDGTQCMNVGGDRIRAADWAATHDEPGGMTLVATEAPTDSGDEAHLERLSRIVTQLDLAKLQAAHRQ